jgi:hypothetical protein
MDAPFYFGKTTLTRSTEAAVLRTPLKSPSNQTIQMV